MDRRERDRGLPASGADADASALLQLLEPGLGVSCFETHRGQTRLGCGGVPLPITVSDEGFPTFWAKPKGKVL